ncbi:MAG: T6SS phospholipase effector Tle1-like catalytic domain-containing protein [Prosthecobacter sp.]
MYKWIPLFVVSTMLAACRTYQVQAVPNPEAQRIIAQKDWNDRRQIEIYFDGTANNWAARTNVRRRFEVAAQAEDPSYPCLYIEGVGTDSLSGKIFGVGMRPRVLTAYKFLARNWRHRPAGAAAEGQDDRILVFGFSRGAFQARMLTGLMAHCGVPHLPRWHGERKTVRPTPSEEAALDRLAEDVWAYCEKHLLDPTQEESAAGAQVWRKRLEDNRSQLQAAMKQKHPAFEWDNPPVELLALWDTVPGLSFVKLSKLGEPEGGRQRFKVRPYPNVKTVVHALSLDDRRSKFEPLLVGAPVDPSATNVYEVWFPGAHSDVGGGYTDSNDMSGSSFNWLQRVMRQQRITSKRVAVYEDPLALAHHPEDLWMHRVTSQNVPRKVPAGAHIDRTVFRRADGGSHAEEGRSHAPYRPKNPVVGGPADGRTLDVASAGKGREAQESYLRQFGLFLHDDEADFEKALPESGRHATGPLSISQMAATWNETPADAPAPTPATKDDKPAPTPP